MAWTIPITWTAGQIVVNGSMNLQIRDNLRFLKGNDGTTVLEDSLNLTGTAHIFIANRVTSANLPATATGGMVYHTGSNNFLFGEIQAGTLKWLDRRDITVMTAASQATGDVYYASGPTSIARLAAGGSGLVLQANGAASPSWTPNAGALALLRAGSGTYTSTAVGTLDNFNVTGLGANDRVLVIVGAFTVTTAANPTHLRIGTTHDLRMLSDSLGQASGAHWAQAILWRGTNSTAIVGQALNGTAGEGSAINLSVLRHLNSSATLNAAWTGTWGMALQSSGMSTAVGGTLHWSWNVYQMKDA